MTRLTDYERRLSSQKLRNLSLAIALLGVALRLRQYFANRSLWLDEASLALNVVDRSLAGLIQPLDYGQAAPIGFLIIQKLMIQVLGNKDYILRIFPLLAGIAAVFLMWKVGESYTEGAAVLLALGLLATSDPMVYYASEAKQYSSDALFSLLLLFFFFRSLEKGTRLRPVIELGLVGAVAMWISHPTLFTLAGIGASWIVDSIKNREWRKLKCVIGVLSLWIMNLAVLFFVSLRHVAADAVFVDYWRQSFMPMPPWRNASWLASALSAMLEDPVGLSATSIAAIAFLLGCISLFLRRWQLAVVLIAPLLTTLLASGLKKYPFSGRLLLFIVPAVVLVIAEGIERLRQLLRRHSSLVAFGLWLLLSVVMLYEPTQGAFQNLRHPNMREHIKPVLSYVSQNRLGTDPVYVYCGAYPAFAYYSSQYGFEDDDYIKGVLSREAPIKYIQDVDRLIGHRRVWFIFSHNCDWCQVNEEAYILEHLDEVGARVDEFRASNASAYLYDLSTPGSKYERPGGIPGEYDRSCAVLEQADLRDLIQCLARQHQALDNDARRADVIPGLHHSKRDTEDTCP